LTWLLEQNNTALDFMQSNQLELISKKELRYVKAWSHGGVALHKRRKIKRPLIPKKITHVVLKSSKAKGLLSFYSHRVLVHQLLHRLARKYFVNLQDYVNMGNHLHLKVKFNDPKEFQNFIRVFCALLSREITGAKKGKPFGQFWDGLAFTRVLHSSFEEFQLRGYFEGNHRERELGFQARSDFLRGWNAFIRKMKKTKAVSMNESELILSLPAG